jgi:disulfide bond formation protein DsbB
MIKFLIELTMQRRYWLGLLLIGLALESAALYYQYVLEEWPCVICIHIRIWIFGFIVISLIAIFCNRWPAIIRTAHAASMLVMIGFIERSWKVLAVERGWIFGDCDMDAGLPPWFALDQWFPAVFEVQTSCGYTPLILLNISMAEVLMVLSVMLFILAMAMFIFSWSNQAE